MTILPKLLKKSLYVSKMLFVFATVFSLLGVTNLLVRAPKMAKAQVATIPPFIADTNPAHKAISAAGRFTEGFYSLAVKPDGTVWAWGGNFSGQLGDGTRVSKATPVPASGLGGVIAVEGGSGGAVSLALKSDGTVWAWGDNFISALDSAPAQAGCGLFRLSCSPTPGQVPGLTNVIAIAAGFQHVLALKSDGTVWAWGDNRLGSLGTATADKCDIFGTLVSCSKTPVQVSGLSGVSAIAASDLASFALKSDGTVWAWGQSFVFGTFRIDFAPAQLPGLDGIKAIAGSSFHLLALKSDGTVLAQGLNGSGQLGNGTTSFSSSIPVQVSNLTGVMAISAGAASSYALKSDGTVWAWGHNFVGQLGNGTRTNSSVPVQVSNLTSVVSIDANGGGEHVLALKSDGTVWAWGLNLDGELGTANTGEPCGGNFAPQVTCSSKPLQVIGQADKDGDGVPDDKDRCPNEPGPASLQGCPDSDGDGIPNIDDNCPNQPGILAYQGCIAGAKAHVDLQNVVSGSGTNTVSTGPLSGARVRVFDRNSTAFLNVTGGKKSPPPSNYAILFESGSAAGLVGQFGECTTGSTGECTVGLFSSVGDYLQIAKHKDPSGKIAYAGKEFGTNDFDAMKLASNNYTIIRVQTPKEVQLVAAGKFTVTGSLLEVTYPASVVWGGENPAACEGMDSSACPVASSSALYPFVFKSDSNWTVDVCASVPTGYSIVGYYDAAGNLVTGTSCVQTLVANTAKTVVFQATHTGSPEPSLEATLKLKDHKGKVTEKKIKSDDIRQETVEAKVKEAQDKAKGQAAASAPLTPQKQLFVALVQKMLTQVLQIVESLTELIKSL